MLSLLVLLACTNRLASDPDAPVQLGDVLSAVWIDLDAPEDGEGTAVLLMIDEAIGCADLAGEYGDTYADPTDPAWTTTGVEVRFSLLAGETVEAGATWPGTYTAGASTTRPDVIVRSLDVLVYDEGTVWALYDDLPGVGIVETVEAAEVTGTIEHDWFEADFRAERCAEE